MQITGGKNLTVRFRVTNTGTREGADVPQVCVLRQGKAKRLVGWGKPSLKPGESQTVTVTADLRVLGDYDVKARQWVAPAGAYGVEIGASASDPVLTGAARLSRQTARP